MRSHPHAEVRPTIDVRIYLVYKGVNSSGVHIIFNSHWGYSDSVVMGEYYSCVLRYSQYNFYFVVCVDEKTSLYPPSAPANTGEEGAPPSYGTEVNQPTRIVYVQAPRQVMFPLLIRKQS